MTTLNPVKLQAVTPSINMVFIIIYHVLINYIIIKLKACQLFLCVFAIIIIRFLNKFSEL